MNDFAIPQEEQKTDTQRFMRHLGKELFEEEEYYEAYILFQYAALLGDAEAQHRLLQGYNEGYFSAPLAYAYLSSQQKEQQLQRLSPLVARVILDYEERSTLHVLDYHEQQLMRHRLH